MGLSHINENDSHQNKQTSVQLLVKLSPRCQIFSRKQETKKKKEKKRILATDEIH